jgi:hypothetical protein
LEEEAVGTVEWSELLKWVPQEKAQAEFQAPNQHEDAADGTSPKAPAAPIQAEKRNLTLASL